jgi:hypothetical protein
MRPPLPADDIRQAIDTTGFPLEHQLTEAFRRAKWSVLSNRYYVDDVDGRARELDLIAYRVFSFKDVDVYTSVLISCKKDSQHTWAFLSRTRDEADKNIDWRPVHFWTDLEPLNTYLHHCDWKSRYFSSDKRSNQFAIDVLRDVFASQLIAPPGKAQPAREPKRANPAKPATAQNDSAIFNSISGLLKALDSEMSALPNRARNKKRLYLFNLAVVVDAPLVDVKYNQGDVEVEPTSELLMLAQYMVSRRHLSAQVRFLQADRIKWFIDELDHLAIANGRFFASLVHDAYSAILTDDSVRKYFSGVLTVRLKDTLNFILEKERAHEQLGSIKVGARDKTLILELDTFGDAVLVLNQNKKAQEVTRQALKQLCRFEGPFRFEEDIPF